MKKVWRKSILKVHKWVGLGSAERQVNEEHTILIKLTQLVQFYIPERRV
jgi:hypothetical protein